MYKFVKATGAAAWVMLVVGGLLPATSGAAPELTHPTGTRLSTGTTLKATDVTLSTTTEGSGSIIFACASTLTGELLKNTGSEIEANISSVISYGTGSSEGCTNPWGTGKFTASAPWCLKANATMAADEFQIRGGRCTEAPKELRFTLDPECIYGRTEPLKGTFVTDKEGNSDAMLTLSGQSFTRKSGSGLLCFSEYKWDVTYTLETDQSVAPPLYLS